MRTKVFHPIKSKIKTSKSIHPPLAKGHRAVLKGFLNNPFSASHLSFLLCFATSSNVTPGGPASAGAAGPAAGRDSSSCEQRGLGGDMAQRFS